MQSDEVRIVNLVGSTGIGKSCLAVQVGHQLIDSGATVSYLDASLLSLDSLPDVIIQTTGSVHGSRNSTERLLHWLRREMKYPIVVILDNFDRMLATDRKRVLKYIDMLFENTAATVKVLITSRKKIPFVSLRGTTPTRRRGARRKQRNRTPRSVLFRVLFLCQMFWSCRQYNKW